MVLSKPPASQVGKDYVPTRATKYHYKTGDSFVSIARKFDMDPLELIWMNFKTGNPREINWYLEHYCGCTKTTRSGKNYVFSSDDRRNGGLSYIYVPRSVIEMPPIEIKGAPPTGVWWGLGMKIDAGAGVSLSPLYAYLFSHDRYSDQCLIYMDGRSATIGAAFGATPVIVFATGVYHPHELQNHFYEGEWDLQLKLGGNWAKLFKAAKGSTKLAPLVNAATKLGRTKMASIVDTLSRKGLKGRAVAETIKRAARLTPDEWADLRTAVKSIAGLFDVSKGRTSPKVDVLEIPFVPIPGAAAAIGKMMAEVKVYWVNMGSRDPGDAELAKGDEWE